MYLSPGSSLQQADMRAALIPSPWQAPSCLWRAGAARVAASPGGTDVQAGHLIREDELSWAMSC